MKRTFQPKRGARKRKLGFQALMATPNGRKTISRRRLKRRKKLTA